MPSKVMDQRHFSPSFFSEEIRFPVERQVGFWKQDSLPDQRVSQPIGVNMRDQKLKLTPEERESFLARERERAASLSAASSSPWRSLADPDALKLPLNFNGSETGRPDINGTRYENGLFSSSFSDILDKKLRYGSRGMALGPINLAHHQETEDQPFELTSEIEAQTIGDLLPDDDDLLSGVLDEIAGLNLSSLHPNDPNGEDLEGDDDIFFTGGGMEMEGLEGEEIDGANLGMVSGASPFVGEHPFGEHPSRTLFVRNINSNVEDTELRLLFEQFGDIRTLYTACKHRGFVMISYFDIRSARNAMRTLQNKPLRRRKLDIHYSIPKDNPTDKDANQGTLVVFNLDANVTNDDLHQIFGVYGEIKEIRETPQKCNHKFIEYYDVRAAETALRALNRSDIAGKKIKLEPSRPGGTVRRFQLGTEIEQDEINGCKHGSPSNSPCFGSLPIENGSLQSAIRAASLSPYLESAFPTLSSSTSLSSPIGIMGPANASVVGPTNGDLPHSLGQQQNQNHQINFGFLPPGSVGPANTFHPHSLPEYHHNNGVGNGSLPYNLTALGIHLNSRSDMPKVGSAALNAMSFDRNEPPFGFSGSGSCPLHGHQQQQQILLNNNNNNTNSNNSSNYHPLHAGPASSSSLLWSNNTLLPPIPRAPSHLLDSLPPLSHHHHVGSAPSIWDRRHLAESMGFPNSPQLHHHPLETMMMGGMPRGGGASQFFNNVSGRNIPQMLVPNNGNINNSLGFEANERGMRGRRSEAGAGQGDNKKQYELDVDKIMRGEDLRTTLMIKNIPNKYTSKMLLAAIDENHRGTYDFIYLPIDFKNKCNVGYAFINMINPQHIVPFYQTFNGKKWEKFNSEKVASLAYARIQGKGALIAHFQNSSLMNEDKRCRPILFHSHGPNAGDQEPFPMGSNIRSRSGRNRSIGSEDPSQESLSLSTANLSDNSSPFDPSE